MRTLLVFGMLSVSLPGQDTALEHSRQVNMERATNMPNFVADEVVTHYVARRNGGRADATNWEHDFTVEDEIRVRGNQVSRERVRRNGRAWGGVIRGLPATGFGAALKPLFDPQCPTTLDFAGDGQLRGKAALVYRFRSPADGCFGNLYGGRDVRWAYNAARTGRIFVDGPSGDVLQFEEEATGFPAGFSFIQRNQVMNWDFVKIGDISHWLPVSADFSWRMGDGSLTRAAAVYKNHRHFEATTNVTFQ